MDKYYVYLHRTSSDDKVFYVGSGCRKRMVTKAGRSIPWNNIVKDHQWYSTILKQDMSKNEARDLEVTLINYYSPKGNVCKTKIESLDFKDDLAYILKTFEYSEISPSGLVYKENSKSQGRAVKLRGDVAGTLNPRVNRYRISINNRMRFTYRIVWLLCTGEDPVDFFIDHIDGNTFNNKISNLRKVTHEVNSKNVKRKANKIGHSNIRYMDGYYLVTLKIFGESVVKCFSTLKYGKELALALSIEYRHRTLASAIVAGETYSERHIGKYEKPTILLDYSEEHLDKLLNGICTSSNNKSGIPNISFLIRNNNKTVVAQKVIGGKKMSKKMSVTKYGLEFSMCELTKWLEQLT